LLQYYFAKKITTKHDLKTTKAIVHGDRARGERATLPACGLAQGAFFLYSFFFSCSNLFLFFVLSIF
jgi:hypothetical protein